MIRAASRRYLDAYRGLPREVWVLALVLFVNRCGTMVLPFLALYLTDHLGLTEFAAGKMISVYGCGSVLGAYLGGRLSETLGSFRVQTVCMFVSVPLFLLIPVWETSNGIAISLLALAVVYEAVRPANATAIARVTAPENRTRAFALQRLAANLGFSFGPAMGGVLATIHFPLLFWVDAATTFLAGVVLLYAFRMRGFENTKASSPPPANHRSPLRDINFVLFLALMLVTLIVFMQFLVTYPLYLRDHYALSKSQIGLLFAVNTSIIVVLEMVLIDYVRHWPLVRLLGWGCCLACVGFGMLPFGTTATYCVLAMVVVTIGEMLSFPSLPAFVAQRSPNGCEGRYMAWYAVTHSIAWVVAPLVGAKFYDYHPDAVWYASLVVGATIPLGFRLLATRTRTEMASLGESAVPQGT